jgi:L-asparagine transporter-like permease
MVAVTSGESRSSKETPRAIWMTFFIFTFVYVGAMLILVGVNFVVLTAALSGANATLYVASRLNHEGSPQNAVLHSAFGIALALAVIILAPKNAFREMLGAAFTGMILSWLVSFLAHISFRRPHSRPELAALPLRSPLGLWGSVLGFLAVAIALVETWLHPLVHFWSGLTVLAALALTFQLLQILVTPGLHGETSPDPT